MNDSQVIVCLISCAYASNCLFLLVFLCGYVMLNRSNERCKPNMSHHRIPNNTDKKKINSKMALN